LELILGVRDYYDQMVFEAVIYDAEIYNQLRGTWTSAAEFDAKLGAMGRKFFETVVPDDELFRRRLDISVLEPVIASPLPAPR
jgi:hypothetical protein